MQFVVAAIAIVVLFAVEAAIHGAARFGAARILRVGGVRLFTARLETRATGEASFARRFAVALAGFVANYIFVVCLFAVAFRTTGDVRFDESTMRVDVQAGGPADAAGLRRGDRIEAVEGEPTPDWATLKKAVATRGGFPIDITFTRDGVEHHAHATPNAKGKIEIMPYAESRPLSLGAAIARGLGAPFVVLVTAARARLHLDDESTDVAGSVSAARDAVRASSSLVFYAALGAYTLPLLVLAALALFPRRARPLLPS